MEQGRRGVDVATSYNSNQCRDAILLEPAARFRFVARGNAEQIEALRSALILLHFFGGVGSRSRRGWGSIEVADPVPQRQQNEEVSNWITRVLGKVPPPQDFSSLAWKNLTFSAFGCDSEIYVTRSLENDYEDVLLQFFRCFESVRSWRKRQPIAVCDHGIEMADALGSHLTDVPERLAFGLPYHPRSRTGHGWDIEYLGLSSGSGEATRRASPLILKVLRVGEKYAGVALFLKSNFFGDPGMQVGASKKRGTKPFPGYRAVDELLKHPIWTQVALPW
jgi:CRISPR/Cas system CMR-associated protein Cmr1 (group 7 of RAMP superfamily)